MKKVALGIVILAVALVVVLFSAKRTRPEPKVFSIGAILPLTGDGAKYGEEARRGIETALKLWKQEKPGVLYEDDQGLGPSAVAAFQRLTSGDGVPLIIGPMYSSTALAVAPVAERSRTVLFSPSASTPALTEKGDYIFRNWPSDIFEGGAMATFVFERLQQHEVVILGQSLDYAMGITMEFKRKYESIGGKIVAEEYYTPGSTDFRTTLTKFKSTNVNCMYLPGMYAEIAVILRQARELGFRPVNVSCVGFDNAEVLKLAGDAAEGVIFARPAYDPNGTSTVVRSFVDTFRSEFGVEPGIYAAHAFDAANIVFAAISRGGHTADGIKQALYETRDFDGVTGKTTIDSNGDVDKPIQFMIVKSNTFCNYEQ